MKLFLAVLLTLCVAAFAFVPATADYFVIINDFAKVNEFLELFEGFPTEETGFICFFGKFSLSVSSLLELVGEEDLEAAANLLDLSIVTDKPEWISNYFTDLKKDLTVIEKGGLTYFCSPAMIDHVRAMFTGDIPAVEVPADHLIYAKSRFLTPFGGLMHLLGFNEGIPLYDELIVGVDEETINIRMVSQRNYEYVWERKKARERMLPSGMRLLKDADVVVAMPVSLLSQLPPELLEELEFDSEVLLEILRQFKTVCLSLHQDFSKVVLSFDVQLEKLQELIDFFTESGIKVTEGKDSLLLSMEGMRGSIPKDGGIGIMLFGAEEDELMELETGLVVKILFKMDEGMLDLSISMADDSLVLQAAASVELLKSIVEEISSEFQPEFDLYDDSWMHSEELWALQTIIEKIDEQYYWYSTNPPETLQELKDLEELIPLVLLEEMVYERTYEDGIYKVEVSIKCDLVGIEFLSAEDVANQLYVDVDEILVDLDNNTITLIKEYEEIE